MLAGGAERLPRRGRVRVGVRDAAGGAGGPPGHLGAPRAGAAVAP